MSYSFLKNTFKFLWFLEGFPGFATSSFTRVSDLVANASNVLFVFSQVLAHVVASGPTLVLLVESPGHFGSTLHNCLGPPGPMPAAPRGNGVDSRLFRCGSIKSTLLTCVLSVGSVSCAVEFLKRASSLDCMAHELSAWSLLIVSVLVSRLHNLLFTVSYRCFSSCMSFLKIFSRSLSVASTLSDICCSFSYIALARLK